MLDAVAKVSTSVFTLLLKQNEVVEEEEEAGEEKVGFHLGLSRADICPYE